MTVKVDIPANASATVRLPSAVVADVVEGKQPLAAAKGIVRSTQEGQTVVVEVGSGRYEFSYPAKVRANGWVDTSLFNRQP
jgi:alpha-L-rhamnosidase